MQQYHKMHEHLADPHRWCKETYARNESGEPVTPHNPTACSWCLYGSLAFVYPSHLQSAIEDRLFDTVDTRFGMGPTKWQDLPETTHDMVLALLKELDI